MCDEAGLRKSHEVMLIITQKWLEGTRRILLAVPNVDLLCQWTALMEEFYSIPYAVVSTHTQWETLACADGPNPFYQDAVVITTYDFAAANEEAVKAIPWELAVFEKANALSTVYQEGNQQAKALKRIVGGAFKLLLTATECNDQAMKKALFHQRKELEKAEARLSELNLLFRKLYEDNALGRLSNEQFVFLTSGYEDEKRELTKRAAALKKEIDTTAERSADVKRFVALVRRYTEINELTYENVHEFIDRILVYELDKDTNTRKIEIFYSFVGEVDSGEQPTESVSYFRQIGADVKSVVV